MRGFNVLALALLAVVTLSSCATKPGESEQDRVDRIFSDACFAVRSADVAFNVAASVSEKIPADAIEWERKVMVVVNQTCSGDAPDVSNYRTVVAFLLEQAQVIAEVMSRHRQDE